ncbi:low temperature requirement protein A [Streptomyces albidoflavus]|uniref:low temperature requirement protein A n=1 Tax=Streptomyces albidoflavus TaxID=1886 RepID=UPI00344B5F69
MTSPPPLPFRSPLLPMVARRRDEEHRVATPLELLFDLCFVVAVGQAGAELVSAFAEERIGPGLLNYAMVFFAVWWAWMNFTWFASAYDNDDVLYRVTTLVQIAGVLVLAAGVRHAFEAEDYLVVWVGYVIMRVALTSQWFRAARASRGPERRTALRYGCGVLACQAGWVALLFTPAGQRPWVFLALAACELSVPYWAERSAMTPWHPHHIAERYGLFTIIVLGESISAATIAVKSAVDEHDALTELLPLAGGGLLIVFSAWWIYFAVPVHAGLTTSRRAFLWGYGHYVVLASVAGIGAGIEIAVEDVVDQAPISSLGAAATATVPTAIYLVSVWALHVRRYQVDPRRWRQGVLPVAAGLVPACTLLTEWAVPAAGVVCVGAVVVGVAADGNRGEERAGGGWGDDGVG